MAFSRSKLMSLELITEAKTSSLRITTNMSKLGVADVAQRAVTLGLFGITMYGAAIFGDGAFDIIRR
jgi:hypothetical protein